MTDVALATKTCVCSRDCVRFDMLEFFNNVIAASKRFVSPFRLEKRRIGKPGDPKG